jgi:MoaA/NifB/PqqE/SkfB family radical SAM enzyme
VQRLRKYFEKIRLKPRPFLAFQIEPTSRCQLNCVMCPRTSFSDEWEAGDMPFSIFKRISTHFHLAQDIHLQGWGEPLLHPRIFHMIQTGKAERCKVSLTTNGLLLTPHISEGLIREGVDIVAVSISGATKETHESIRCGSNFVKLIDNIKTLSDRKLQMKSKTPRLVLSYLMTTTNVEELPKAVDLAKEIGANEIVATNLDFTPGPYQDDLKVFSCNVYDAHVRRFIEDAGKRAGKINLQWRSYPLTMEEVIMCELNPLQILFISCDGCVSPCVYLNMTKKGSIPRFFCGERHDIQRVCFGNISEKDLMEIWDGTHYREFRSVYGNRVNLLKKRDAILGFESTDIEKAEREIKEGLAYNPVPDVCKTCYKAYGI